jgi:superfamily II DNA or RNA helicase
VIAPTLRPYQEEALAAVLSASVRGTTRQLVSLSVGLGKTVIFARLPGKLNLKKSDVTLIVAHRKELLDQAMAKVREAEPHAFVQLEKADLRANPVRPIYLKDNGPFVIVASVATLVGDRLGEFMRRFGSRIAVLIIDECFPSGTLVDGRPIESYEIGDAITAFDEVTQTLVKSRVTRLFKKRATRLVRVYAGCKAIVCTPNHPFLTNHGWVNAEQLRESVHTLYRVREYSGSTHQMEVGHIQATGPRLLHEGLRDRIRAQGEFNNHGGYEPPAGVGAYDGKEPDALARISGQDDCDAQRNWAQTQSSRREWPRTNDHGISASIRLGLGNVPSGDNVSSSKAGSSIQLQARRSESRSHDFDRSGWVLPRPDCAPRAGSEEDCDITSAWVDRVEVLEPGGEGTFGGVCSDGFVYNLEVEIQHTYLAEGFVVHNCHHAAAPTYMNLIARIKDARESALVVGVTATPKRGDNVGLDAAFDEIVYSRDIKWAIREGWLVPVSCWKIRTKTSLDGVATKGKGGDFQDGALSRRINNDLRNNEIVSAYQQYTPGKKFLVFCASVAHATEMARVFTEAGVSCGFVSGETPVDERTKAFADIKSGALIGLANCGIAIEGYDNPGIEVVITARPTKSSGLFTQMIGRCLRPLTEIASKLLGEPHMIAEERRAMIAACAKPEAIILDVCDKGAKSVITMASLWGLPAKLDLQGKKVDQVAEAVEEIISKDADAAEALEALAETPTAEQVELFEFMETLREKIDLFVAPGEAEDIGAQLAWTFVNGTYWLNLPVKTIAMDRDGNFIPDFDRKYKAAISFCERARERATSLNRNADPVPYALASLNVDPSSVIETREHLQIIPDALAKNYAVVRVDMAQTVPLGTVPTIQEAFERAERWVAHNRPLVREVDGETPWRYRPAHPSQVDFLKKHGQPIPRSQGEADLAISVLIEFLKKAKARA